MLCGRTRAYSGSKMVDSWTEKCVEGQRSAGEKPTYNGVEM